MPHHSSKFAVLFLRIALFVGIVALATAQVLAAASAPEILEKRTETTKFFPERDGQIRAEIYGSPVHYRDAAGKWQDIDTTLEDMTRLKDNDPNLKRFGMAASVPALSRKGAMGLAEDVSGRLIPIKGQFDFAVVRNKFGFFASKNPLAPLAISLGEHEAIFFKPNQGQAYNGKAEKKGFGLKYPGVWKNATLQYAVSSTLVKEEIVLDSADAPSTYEFSLAANGLTPRLSKDNVLEFLSSTGEIKATMLPPSARDAEGEVVMLNMEARIRGKAVDLKLGLDETWLRSAKSPVVIDPSVLVQTPNADAYIDEYRDTTAKGSTEPERVRVGIWRGIFIWESRLWGLLKFDLSSIPTDAFVTQDATLSMHCFEVEDREAPVSYEVHTVPIPVDWNETAVTYRNLLNAYPSLPSPPSDLRKGVLPNAIGAWSKSVYKNDVQDWVRNPTSNKGMLMWSFHTNGYNRHFYSKDAAVTPDFKPKLTVTYQENRPPTVAVTTAPTETKTALNTVLAIDDLDFVYTEVPYPPPPDRMDTPIPPTRTMNKVVFEFTSQGVTNTREFSNVQANGVAIVPEPQLPWQCTFQYSWPFTIDLAQWYQDDTVTWTVKVFDGSLWSAPTVVRSLLVDSVLPTISSLAATPNTDSSLKASWAASDTHMKEFVLTYNDGSNTQTFTLGPTVFEHTLPNAGFDKVYQITLTARDLAGNATTSSLPSVYTLPEQSKLYQPASAKFTTTAPAAVVFKQVAAESYKIERTNKTTSTTVSTAYLTPQNLTTGPDVVDGGTTVKTFRYNPPTDAQSGWTITPHHVYQYRITTTNKKPTAPDTVVYTATDNPTLNNPPVLTVTPPATLSKGDVSMQASASDLDGDLLKYKFELYVPGESTPKYSSDPINWQTSGSYTFTNVANGIYKWVVSVRDGLADGTVSQTATTEQYVEVNNVPPTVAFTINGGQAYTTSRTVNLTSIQYTGRIKTVQVLDKTGAWQNATGTPAEITGWELPAADGLATVSMKVESVFGVWSTVCSRTITVDGGVPDVPILTATGTTNAILFSWNRPADHYAGGTGTGSGIDHYLLQKKVGTQMVDLATVADAGTSNSYTVSGLGYNDPLTVQVRAVDKAGNQSVWSVQVTGYSLAQAGTLQLIEGSDTPTSGLYVQVTMTAATGAQSYTVKRDGVSIHTTLETFKDYGMSSHATHTYTVITTNTAGEQTTSQGYAITLGNHLPVFGQPSVPQYANSRSITLGIPVSDVDKDTLQVTYLWSSNGGASFTALTGNTLSVTTDGTFHWKARVNDGYGTTDSQVYTVVVDTVLPIVTRDNTSTSWAVSQTVTVTASDERSGVKTVQYRWNGGSWVTKTAPFTVTAPNQGSNMLEVSAVDNAGNNTVVSWTYLVDSGPPVISSGILNLPGALTKYAASSSVAASWSITHLSAIITYQYAFVTDSQTKVFKDATISGTSATFGGSFVHGKTYTLWLRAQNQVGLWSADTVLGSFVYDATPPTGTFELQGGRGIVTSEYAISSVNVMMETAIFNDPESGVVKTEFGFQAEADGQIVWRDTWDLLKAEIQSQGLKRFSVYARAQNGATIWGTSSPIQVLVDDTPADLSVSAWRMAMPGRQGIGVEIRAQDAESGLQSLKYKIGTALGGDDVSAALPGAQQGWLSVSAVASQEVWLDMTLSAQTDYYVTVEAVNNAGLVKQTTAVTPPPGTPVVQCNPLYSIDGRVQVNVSIETSQQIAAFRYRVERTDDGSYITSWNEYQTNQPSTSWLIEGLPLTQAGHYKVHVETRFSDNTLSPEGVSPTVTIDTTPANVQLNVPNYAPQTGFTVRWTSEDLESGCILSRLTLGLERASHRQTLSPINLGGGAQGVYVVTPSLFAQGLQQGDKIYVTLEVTNGAGLVKTLSAAPVTVDTTGPNAFSVALTGEYTNSALIWVRWPQGSHDAESGIREYQYAVFTTPYLSNAVVPWKTAGNDTSAQINLGAPAEGTQYFVAVKAINGAGIELIEWSKGIIYDSTKPKVVWVDIGDYTTSKSSLTVSIDAADEISGIASIVLTILDETETVITSKPMPVAGSKPYMYTFDGLSLQEGAKYTVAAVATDGAGNSYGGRSAPVMVATIAPTMTANAVACETEFVVPGQATSFWWTAASTGTAPVDEYEYAYVLSDATPTTWIKTNSLTSIILTLNGYTDEQKVSVYVRAKDRAGLISNTAVKKVTIDSSRPVIAPFALQNAYIHPGTEIPVTASDPTSNITKYRFAIGTAYGESDVTSGWIESDSATLKLSDFPSLVAEQTYFFSAMAQNGAGLWSALIQSGGYKLDSTAPEIQKAIVPAYTQDKSSITGVQFEAADLQSGIVAYSWTLKNAETGAVVGSKTYAPQLTSLAVVLVLAPDSPLTEGSQYVVEFMVRNGAGVETQISASQKATVDSTKPVVTITSQPPAVVNEAPIQIKWTSNEDGPVQASLTKLGGGVTTGDIKEDGPRSYSCSFALSEPGLYTVTITATDLAGNESQVMYQVRKNAAPSVAISAPAELRVGQDGTFSVTASDTDGSCVSYLWTFGDDSTSTEMNPTHRYALAKKYTVTLKVTDNDGGTTEATAGVQVNNTRSGALLADEVWDVDTTIDGDIIVPLGITLTIKNGVNVTFNGNFGVFVYGTLKIEGQQTSRVTFKPQFEGRNSWKGIRFEDAATSSIQYADIRWATVGLSIIQSMVTVSNCTFSWLSYGIHVYGACHPVIDSCQFIDITMYGIKEDAGGMPTVSNCVFTHTTGTTYVGDYYDEELTILEPEQTNGLHGNPANTGNHN